MMASEMLTIETQIFHGGDVRVLTLCGPLDAYTFEQLEAVIQETLDNRCYHIAIDLSRVDYISSAGVGVFFRALSDLRLQGGEVLLVDMHPQVRTVFELLGVVQFFQTEESRDEAMTRLTGKAQINQRN